MIQTIKDLIERNQIQELIVLIKKQPAILDQKDEKGNSGFNIIAYSGLPEVFEVAKENKIHFSFHDAILSGNRQLVDLYLSQDKSVVNHFSNDGFTPLSLASYFNQNEIAKTLLDQGADPNLQALNPTKVNALHAAIARGNYELCKLFLDHGADANIPQKQGVTPLHAAAHRGHLDLVKLLIKKGAHVAPAMDTGETAISLAKKDGHQDVIDFLEQATLN